MQCLSCHSGSKLAEGICAHCGDPPLAVPAQFTGQKSTTHTDLPTYNTLPSIQQWEMGDLVGKGQYRIVERLSLPAGQREQGAAWLVTDTKSRPTHFVVLREICLARESSEKKMQMVQDIVSFQKKLGQHPGLASVLDDFAENDTHYIVFQHVEGLSLEAQLKRSGGALPESVVAEYGRQLCEILTLFSRQRPPFVHGSISLDTVIVSPDQEKVSLLYPPLLPLNTISDKKAGNPLPGMAPEQARGAVVPASDLYSVAAVIHHAITGYDPRERMSFFYPPARRLNPRVTLRMEEILARQLHFSISQRYPRPSDMQADLAALLATAFLQQEKLSMPIAVRRPAQSHLSAKQLRAWSRTRTLLHMSTIGLCGLLALIALFVPLLLSILTPAIQTKKLQEAMALLAAEEQLIFSSKKVGLSDGRFIFDTYDGRGNVALKQQGGQALQQGDLASAVNFFSQAVAVDPTDGEAQIHNENIHVLQRGSPYLTIVLGLAFDQKNPENLISARVDTQAAFVAQHLINKNGLLPRGLQLRILIANSGSDRADVATVAQLVANRVSKAGNPDNFVAVVGWPFSSQTINARDIIASVRLPLVSQTSSSVQLSGSSPYFFRVNPADDLQGEALGEVAVQQLKAKKILVLRDPLDSYSISLADAFSASVKELGAQAINNRTHYFIESVTSVSEFQKIVNDGISQKVDLFFIAGFSVDGVRLAHALGNAVRADPLNKALPKLKILGGDGLSTGLVLGEGDGPDAQIARKFPQDMQRLIFSAFGTSGVWDFIGIPKGQQSAFIADWISFYQSSGIDTNNTSSPGNDAILTADAVLIIVEAVSLVQGTVTGQAVRDALVSLGKGGVSAYQGISGRIVFDAQGDPIDKAMVILFVERNDKGKGNVIKLRQVVGTFS